MNTLTATKRSKTEKLANIRNNGMVPAVVYGAQVENTPISVSSVDFGKIYKLVGETNTIVLEIEDKKTKTKKKVDVLIYDRQIHPVNELVVHIDFLAVDMGKVIEVKVPIEFIGKSLAEKNNLGVLVKVLHEFEIQALPKNIPDKIIVNISSLAELDSQIHTKNVEIPTGVKMITEGDEVVALIAPIKEEEIVEESPVDLSAIEVEKKGKKEETAEAENDEKEKSTE